MFSLEAGFNRPAFLLSVFYIKRLIVLKKILLTLLLLTLILAIIYRDLLSYGWMQAKGQIGILWNVEDVTDVLKDASFPDSLKSRIRLIEEIKKFGVDSLGLTPSKNYTTFYN